MKYRKLNKYKYQLVSKDLKVKINHSMGKFVETDWVIVNGDTVTVKKGYCWDGASCAIDTHSFMVSSLVHDALYQLMRLQIIPDSYRENADKILKDLCLKYGMSKIRANYVYVAVRLFGGKHLKLGEPQDIIYEIEEIK